MQTKNVVILTLGLILLFGFQNCSAVKFSPKDLPASSNGDGGGNGGSNPPPPPPKTSTPLSQTFHQPPENFGGKVDILFVVDSSGSLDVERGVIADHIEKFVTHLPQPSDYRIGVILAHSPLSSHFGLLYRSDEADPFYIDSTELTVEVIQELLHSRVTGLPSDYHSDGGEEGLLSISQFLSQSQVPVGQGDDSRVTASKSFLRSDAALAVVFVADENDICADYPNGVVRVPDEQKNGDGVEIELAAKARDCQNLTANSVYLQMTQVKGEMPLLVTGVLYSDPATTPDDSENEVGYGYIDVINANQGFAVDIGSDIATGLSAIGQLLSKQLVLRTQFQIANTNITNCATQVIPASIRVSVDGVSPVSFDFSADTCTLTLAPANTGQARSEIVVSFEYYKL